MSERAKGWIVKDGEGRIFGPFSHAQILKQIEDGSISGSETIARYPGGDWKSISAAPEFYDKLLEAIASSGGGEKRSGSRRAQKIELPEAQDPDEPQTPVTPARVRGRVVRENDSVAASGEKHRSEALELESKLASKKNGRTSKGDTRVGKSSKSDQNAGPVIELTDMKLLRRSTLNRSAKLPMILIGAAALMVIAALLIQPETKGERIHLLAPRKGQPALSTNEVKERFRAGLAAFVQDTFPAYMKAQEQFSQIVEGAPKNGEGYASLCLAYRELWPYTTQDAKDLSVIHQVMLEANRADPVSLNSGTCEIVFLMASNRVREARGKTDTWLEVQAAAPTLFDFTAEFLRAEKKLVEAASYAEKTRVLWPQWLKPYVIEARMRAELRQFQTALQLYQTVIKANPNHQVARIELAVLEYAQFGQTDKALEMLLTALGSDTKILRDTAVQGHLVVSQIYERRNKKAQALAHAQKAFALNSANASARQAVLRLGGSVDLKASKRDGGEILFLGDQHVRNGDYFAAQAEYKAAFEADPKNATAAIKAGKALWQLNQSAEAIEWMKKAIKADPKITTAYVMLADYYSQRFDYLSAVRTLQKIQQIAPRSYEVWRGYAQVDLRRNNFKDAIQFAKKSIELYEADVETHVLLAEAQRGAMQYTDALASVNRAVELDSSNVEAQSLKARVLASVQGVDVALEYSESLIRAYQQVPEYLVTKGEILYEEERYAQAVTALNEARSIDSSNKKATLLLGKALQAQGINQDALKAFLDAAEMDPSDANPIFLAGLLYFQDNKFAEAIRQFKRVLIINPRYPRAHYQLGLTYLKMGTFDLALQESELERAINPNLADAFELAAETFYMRKQFANCASHYQKAVSLRSADTEMYVKMARCYRLSGAVESALSLLKQAAARESGSASIYKELGATYHVRGLASEAIESYTRYLQLAPTANDRAEIDGLIRRLESGDMNFGGQ